MAEGQNDFEKEKIERLRRAMYSREISPQLKERDRRALHDVHAPVGDEWERDEPTLPKAQVAPRGIGVGRMVMRVFVVGAGAFFIGAAAFFGYYFTLGGGASPVSSGNIDITVVGPLQVSGGEPVSLQVSIVNRNQAPLQTADLVVTYPAGTRSPSDITSDLPQQRISLGNIEPGGRRQGTVSAVVAGKEGDRVTIPIELEYRVAGSNSIFVARTTYVLTFISSPLSIVVDGNTEAVAGQPVELTVTISSNAATVQKDVVVSVEYPFGFVPTTVEPAPAKPGLWTLGDLSPGAKRTITLRGTVKGEVGDLRAFHFRAGTRGSSKDTGVSVPLADSIFKFTVSQPFIGLSITANKGTGSGAVVGAGETVTVNIGWKNNLDVPITDAVIVAHLSGLAIDDAKVKTSDGFYRSSDNVVLWDKSTTGGALASLAPGVSGTVSFAFDMPESEVLALIRDPHIVISVNAAGSRLSETGVPQNLQSAASQTVKVASDLQLIAQGLYYTNPFGSSGPMPPKAGAETTYALVFTIMNTTSKISGTTVTADLPAYVRWTGVYSPSSEKIEFDSRNGRIIWHVGDVEPGVGINGVKPRQAAISIGFTPSATQIGAQPVVAKNIQLSGLDTSTNLPVTRAATPDLTTNLANVAQSSGAKYSGEAGFTAANANVVK